MKSNLIGSIKKTELFGSIVKQQVIGVYDSKEGSKKELKVSQNVQRRFIGMLA